MTRVEGRLANKRVGHLHLKGDQDGFGSTKEGSEPDRGAGNVAVSRPYGEESLGVPAMRPFSAARLVHTLCQKQTKGSLSLFVGAT